MLKSFGKILDKYEFICNMSIVQSLLAEWGDKKNSAMVFTEFVKKMEGVEKKKLLLIF